VSCSGTNKKLGRKSNPTGIRYKQNWKEVFHPLVIKSDTARAISKKMRKYCVYNPMSDVRRKNNRYFFLFSE
jgi:hypothetical protein